VKFTVNGKPRELAGEPTIADYLRHLGVNPLAVAVEMDGIIVKRDRFDVTRLHEGAQLEVVRMMGGGSPRERR
jgi:thiamine biosynthesis protein ThiS